MAPASGRTCYNITVNMPKNNTIKAIIFDWGRTIYDTENHRLFPEVKSILEYLHTKYKLALVSLVKTGTIDERWQVIETNDLKKYFTSILFTETDKDTLYHETLAKLNLGRGEICIVDDRTIRGIAWGNKLGAMTIWLKKGKFANELPNEETGAPTYIIHELNELLTIL